MTTLPHTFKRIRLNLARSKEFPQGSARHGYEFVAPLDDKGHIDVGFGASIATIAGCAGSGTARTTRSVSWCTSRAAPSTRAGSSTTSRRADDDESGYRFGAHAFRHGEYVSIRDDDGEMHTFPGGLGPDGDLIDAAAARRLASAAKMTMLACRGTVTGVSACAH